MNYKHFNYLDIVYIIWHIGMIDMIKKTMYNIHISLMNNKKNNKTFMSFYQRNILKHIKNYCINFYPNIYIIF